VILEAIFDTMLNTVRNRFHTLGIPSFPSAELLVFWGGRQWGFNGFAHNPVEYARSLNCPSLFMHGANDPRATVADGRRVFAVAPGPKEFKEFESAGHEAYVSMYPDEWRTAVAKIMKRPQNRIKAND
jgi:pimeloyl-ACP methyl ester carboxylesterase